MIKLRLKATGDEDTFSRQTWERSKHRAELWEVIDEGDPVMAIELKEDGNHKELYYMDRDHAQKMIKPRADKYSLIEYHEAKEIMPKIPIDPEKINLEQKQKDEWVKQLEAESPGPIQTNDFSTREQRLYERTGQLPKDKPNHEELTVDGWIQQHLENHQTTAPHPLSAIDIGYLNSIIDEGSAEERGKLSKLMQDEKLLFDVNSTFQPAPRPIWSVPKIKIHLWNVNFSLVWLSVSLLTFFAGFYLSRQYNLPNIKLTENEVWITICLGCTAAGFGVSNLIHNLMKK